MTDADELDRDLREHYLSVAQAKVDAVSAALAEARRQRSDAGSIEHLRVLVHKIAGSAGAYGFDSLGIAAKALEKRILAAPRPLAEAVLLGAERFLADMTAEFAAARRCDAK
jgi:HPt (histidine-containing phosphotransfer) domain-containing protein